MGRRLKGAGFVVGLGMLTVVILGIGPSAWPLFDRNTRQETPFGQSQFVANPPRGDCHSSPESHLGLTPETVLVHRVGNPLSVRISAQADVDLSNGVWSDGDSGSSVNIAVSGSQDTTVTFRYENYKPAPPLHSVSSVESSGYCSITIRPRALKSSG